jgi:hypothetical protein
MWWRTVTLRDHYRLSWKEIAEDLGRHVDTVKNYYKIGTAELVYEDTIHFFLTEQTRRALQKLGVDTMSFSGTQLADEAARSYFANKPLKGIGPARAKEILDAIEDLYDSRANRERVAGSGRIRPASAGQFHQCDGQHVAPDEPGAAEARHDAEAWAVAGA